MTQKVRPDDRRLSWQGAISFNDTNNWRMPWRIPFDHISLYPPDALRERAGMSAGVRIACHTDTEFLAGYVEPAEECSNIDLFCDGELQGSVELAGHTGFRFEGLPAGEKLLELWLPQHGEFRLRGLEISDAPPSVPTRTPVQGGSPTEAPSPTAVRPRVPASPGPQWRLGSTG